MQLIDSKTIIRSGPGEAAARTTPFRSAVLGEGFEGTARAMAPGRSIKATGRQPLLETVMAALAQDDLLEALSWSYGKELSARPMRVMLIQRMATTCAFLVDRPHRRRVLELLWRQSACACGLLVVHPPAVQWRAAGPAARFRLHRCRSKDLLLCVLLGELGFAQLCDDRLPHAVPLLIQPWSAEQGLLRPARLPEKSFSQSLCVSRLEDGRLLLFDKHSTTS